MKWLLIIILVGTIGVAVAGGRHGGNSIGSGPAPDGSFIEGTGASFSPITGSGTSFLTTYGTFTFGPYRTDIIPGSWCHPLNPIPNGCSDFYELYLNGHRIAPQAQRFSIEFGGIPFYSEEDQNTWQWVGYRIQPNMGIYPTPATPGRTDVPAPPNYNPPYTPSPDGSAIFGFSGTLTTSEGLWSWGNVQSGGYEVRLNGTDIGVDPPHTVAIQLQVNSNGHMFIQHQDSTWRVYLDYAEVPANAPTGQAIPLRVDMMPTASPISPACGDLIFRLPNVGSVGRQAGFFTVPMSDGSAFAGTVTVNANSGITLFNASVDGSGLVTFTTKQNPLYGLDNFAGVSFTVSQNGTTVGGYHFWFDTGSC